MRIYIFGMSNSMKQGGILSPTLFNIYLDSMCTSLYSTKIGEQLLNNLCYAYDLCLIRLSSI